MPGLVDSLASTDTQKAVSNCDVFSFTINGISSSSSRVRYERNTVYHDNAFKTRETLLDFFDERLRSNAEF